MLQMDGALGRAGAAGAVQPERGVILVRVGGVERRARLVDQSLERGKSVECAARYDEVLQARQQVHDRKHLGDQRRADNRRGRPRVVQHELVVSLPQECVDRHRHGADLDRTQKARIERRAVMQDQSDALLGSDAERSERVARPVHQRVELAEGDRTIGGNQGGAAAPPVTHVACDEMLGDVEGRGNVRLRLC